MRREAKTIKTVTICGSMKFEKEMKQIAWKLEVEEGFSVIQCVYNPRNESVAEDTLKQLAAAHYQKIDISDAIYVVDIGGYFGESAAAEIAYAEKKGKEILYHSRLAREDETI